MTVLSAGITPAGEGVGGIVWNILGQTYKPVASCASSFAFEAVAPPGTFVPPHIHTTQDEFIRVLEGELDLVLDGQPHKARAGDLVRMPMGIMHGFWSNGAGPARALFWVSPARSLETLFQRIHNVPDPAEVIRLAAEHEVEFLPPPG